MSKQPNFVFIITDQQRADYLSCTGHPVLKTPNIDKIAQNGTIFNRFHVANPVCMPNRACLLTGRHSSVNGVRMNGNDLPMHMATFPQALNAHGYDTALIGKSHVQTFTDIPAPIGKNPRGKGPLTNAIDIGDEAQYLQEDKQEWKDKGRAALQTPFYGYDHVDLVTFHGDMTGGAHEVWIREQTDAPDQLDQLRGPENQLDHDYTCPQAIRTALPEELYSTQYIQNCTTAYLSDPARQEKPFFTFVSFPDPHHPFTPPGKYWDMYKPEDMPVPDNFDDPPNAPPHLQWVKEQEPAPPTKFTTMATHMNRRQAQEAMALTCGMIAMIDDAVGEIMQTLEAQGLADNTILVFTADHGDYLGDHGLLFKGGLHYQSLIRVPMLWCDPRQKQPAVIDELCSTLDFAPTIMAQAGVPAFHGIQGVDISSLLDGSSQTLPRDRLLIEEDTYEVDILGFDGQVRERTLLKGQYRISVFQDKDWGEIYDLKADPLEMRNLWDEPEYRELRNELMWELLQALMTADDRSPWPKLEA
ncbi:MAG: sulfatase family protein [Thiolinea sp.]